MEFPEKIQEALSLLDKKLQKNSLSLNLTVLGSMALYLNGYSFDRQTDLDVYNKNIDPDVICLINEVTQELGLSQEWINNGVSSIYPLPENYESRLAFDSSYKNIKLYIVSIDDLICLKVNAIYSRDLAKDIDDLKLLNPTESQLETALKYIKYFIEKNHSNSVTLILKLNKELDNFKEELNEKLK